MTRGLLGAVAATTLLVGCSGDVGTTDASQSDATSTTEATDEGTTSSLTPAEAQRASQDRAAQSSLRAALIAAKVHATEHDGLFETRPGRAIRAADMEDIEPLFDYAAEGGVGVIGVKVDRASSSVRANSRITLWMASKSGHWYGLLSSTSEANYCEGDSADAVRSPDTCKEIQWQDP